MAGPIRIAIVGDASNAVRAFQQTESAAGKMRSGIGGAVGTIAKTVAGIGVAAGGLVATMGGIGIKTAASMQQSNIAFSTMLGSTKAAQQHMGELSSFAAKTPFEMPGLIQASRQLIGVGMSSKKVIPTLTAFGDASGALGLNQDQFNRVMLATTQSMGKGKVQAEEMMQMTEAGLPVWPLLSKAVGLPVASLMDMAKEGKLLASDVFPALQAQMTKDYGGAMAKQSETLTGRWSTLKDTIRNGLGTAILPLAPAMGSATAGVNKFAEGALKKLATFITATVVPAIDKFKAQWKANIDGSVGGETRQLLETIGRRFKSMFSGGQGALKGFFSIMETKVIPGLRNFKNDWEAMASGTAAGELHKAVSGIADAIKGLFAGGGGAGAADMGTKIADIGASVKELGPFLTQVKDAMPSFNDVLSVAGTVLGFLADHTKELAKWMPTIIAAFIAWKVAQIAGNAAMVISIPLRAAEVITNYRLAGAIRSATGAQKVSLLTKAKDAIATAAHKVATLASAAATAAWGLAQKGLNALMGAGKLAAETVKVLAHKAAVWASEAATKAWAVAQKGMNLLMSAGKVVAQTAALVAQKAVVFAISAATKVWAGIQWLLNAAMTANPIGLIVAAVVALIAIIVLIATKTTWFQTIWKVVWAGIKAVGMAVWNAIKAGFAAFMGFLQTIIRGGMAVLKGVWAGLQWLGDLAATIWSGIKKAFFAAVQFVRGLIENFVAGCLKVWDKIKGMASVAGDLVGKVRDIFQGWWDWMVALPGKIIDGLINGFKSMWGKVKDLLHDLVDMLPGIVKKVLGIHSPARVFHGLGANTAQGLADGMAAKDRIIKAAAANQAKTAAKAAEKAHKAAARAAEKAAKARAAKIAKAQKAEAAKRAKAARARQAAIVKAQKAAAKAASMRATAKTNLRKLLPDMIGGLTGTPGQIKSMSAKLTTQIEKAFTGKKRTDLVRRIALDTSKLQAAAAKRDRVAADFNVANAKLQEQQKARAEMAADISSTVRASFALVAQGEEGAIVSTTGIIERAQKALAEASKFSTALINLRAKGLNQQMLAELAKAGPEAGLATAQALAGASESELAKLNETYSAIGRVAGTTGDVVAGSMYDAGIAAAQGIVNGLLKQKQAIEDTMLKIALGMQTAIKRALGIKSPSRVFEKFGQQTIAGFAEGFESVSGNRLMGDLSSELTRAAPSVITPTIAGIAGGGIAGAGAGIIVNVNVTDMHADPAEVGRQVVKQVRAYERATGRPVLVSS